MDGKRCLPQVCLNLLPPSDEGAGVRWTPLRSRSTDRGGSRDGGFAVGKDGGREKTRGNNNLPSVVILKYFNGSFNSRR